MPIEFNPDLTPDQMEALGVLSGKYNDKNPREGNFFGVDASMKEWKPEWKRRSAPMGWYQWYQQYHAGKRTKDDERQIKRWASFKARHLAQLRKADPTLENLSIQPRRRQALLHWGIAPGIDVEKALSNKYLEKAASMYERAKYHSDRKKLDYSDEAIHMVKYDGANFFLSYDEAGVPKLISRRKSVTGDILERSNKVPHLAKTLPSQAGKVYNVELIHTGHSPYRVESHLRVSGILNSLAPKALQDQAEQGPIRAVVFDVIHPKLPTYADKMDHIKGLVEDFGDKSLVFHPEFHVGHMGFQKVLEQTVRENREGVISIDPTRPEDKNPRVKLKHVNHYNLKVSGIIQERDLQGNPKESAGALSLVDASGRDVGKVGTGFSREMRKQIWENQHEWVGRLIQVKAGTPTAHKLRMPVYNGDSDGELDTV